jgi:hypothetical protein
VPRAKAGITLLNSALTVGEAVLKKSILIVVVPEDEPPDFELVVVPQAAKVTTKAAVVTTFAIDFSFIPSTSFKILFL